MNVHTLPTIAIIGSGRVATSLGHFFVSKGIIIKGLHSRNKETGKVCASKFNCTYFDRIEGLDADFILVAVSDDQITAVINQIPSKQAVLYTAGSVSLNDIKHPNTGVFYPLQTFSGLEIDIQFDFPVLIESKTEKLSSQIQDLCRYCKLQFDLCDSNKRSDYHLVAVFLNNFINHIGSIAKAENDDRNLSWSILKPLLDKTVFNILNNKTLNNQTGPAERGDFKVINKHEKMLNEQHLSIYKALTESIIKTSKSR